MAKAVLEKWKPGKFQSIEWKWLCPKIPSKIAPIVPNTAPNTAPIIPNIAPNIPKVTPISAPPIPNITGKNILQRKTMKSVDIVFTAIS